MRDGRLDQHVALKTGKPAPPAPITEHAIAADPLVSAHATVAPRILQSARQNVWPDVIGIDGRIRSVGDRVAERHDRPRGRVRLDRTPVGRSGGESINDLNSDTRREVAWR